MSLTTKILLADGDPEGLTAFSSDLELKFQCTFLQAVNPEELLATFSAEKIDILVIDNDIYVNVFNHKNSSSRR